MPRPILVVAAWEPELRGLRAALARDSRLARRVVTGVVGVGLVEAAVGGAGAVGAVGPRAVVLVGTAGCYPGGTLAVGAAVAARRVVLACPAVASGAAYWPAPLPTTMTTGASLRRALGAGAADVACPLAITRTRAAALRLREASGCDLENLEAFAVGRAAGRVPFAAVLGVANEVGPAAHRQWKVNAAAAAAVACDTVIRWLRAPTRR